MKLHWKDIAILTSFPLLMSVGQLLFKQAAQKASGVPWLESFSVYLAAPVFYLAMVLYGCATILWLWILSRYSLALAYPFGVFAIAIVPFLESWFFHNALSTGYWLGLSLIILGAFVIVRVH